MVTILTWVSANAWTKMSNKVIKEYFNDSDLIYLMFAIIVTLFAVLILNYFFAKSDTDPNHVVRAVNIVKRKNNIAITDDETRSDTEDYTVAGTCTRSDTCTCGCHE